MARTRRTMQREDAEEIAARALAFLASEPAQLSRFLALTGLEPADVRGRVGSPELLAAVRPAARALLDEALLERARRRALACPSPGTDDETLRCRAEVLRLSGQPADGSELLAALAGGPIACRAAGGSVASAVAP